MDEERKADLEEGERAAGSILDRANEALGKEHRLAAMTELQGLVEDWKGHKMDHFGDLLLYGSFTVLKGEGAKEVPREVRNIFDSLNPKCRAIVRRACQQVPSLRIPRSCEEEPISASVLSPGATTPTTASSLSRFQSALEGVPEEAAEEADEEPMAASKGTLKVNAQADLSPKLKVQPICGSKLVRKKPPLSIFIPTKKLTSFHYSGPSRTPSTPTFFSKPESAPQLSHKTFKGYSGKQKAESPTLSRIGRGKAAGALRRLGIHFNYRIFKNGKVLQVLRKPECADDPYNLLNLFNGPFFSSLPLLFSDIMLSRSSTHSRGYGSRAVKGQKQRKQHVKVRALKLERELANESGFDLPVRVQYKVYLFERILLCCKEINPNKPKNKMLGTNKPLIDKKGKPRLQLRGRIFMQNVTDVVSLVKAGMF